MGLQRTEWKDIARIAFLVIGQAGTGKTSLIRTICGQQFNFDTQNWENTTMPPESICVLSAENGLLCVQDLVKHNVIESWNITCLGDFQEAAAELANGTLKDRSGNKYKWIFIDSLTEIAKKCKEAIEDDCKKEDFRMWGLYYKEMEKLVKQFRDMKDYHIVFTCLENYDSENKIITPMLDSPRLRQELPSYFDEVFRMEKKIIGDKVKVEFATSFPVGLAKDRSGLLNKYEEAHLLKIRKKVFGDI